MKKYNTYLWISLLLMTMSACEEMAFEKEPESNAEALFEYLWHDFDQHYAPFEERGVDWEALYEQYRPMVNHTMSEEELYEVMTHMLAHLDDGHVKLSAPNKSVFNANAILNEYRGDQLFDLDMIKSNYLKGNFQEGTEESYVYGLLEDNIIYLHLPWIAENFAVIHEVIDTYPEAKGLILDLRHNEGGDFTYCFSEMGRFTQEKRLIFTSQTKNGPGEQDYTAWYDWYITPAGQYYDKKMVVLTDRYTISAGERSVMAFMTLPNAVILGDTTCGAHSTMIGRELANGWHYSLATQKVKLFDGQSYEGIGLMPDIHCVNTQEEVEAGIDKTLERATAIF